MRVTRVQLFRPPPPPRPCRPSLAGGLGRLLRVFQRLPSRGAHVDEDGLTCPRNGRTLAFPGLEKRVLLSLLTLGTAGQVCDAPSWPAGSAICCVHARRGPCPACGVIAGPFPGRLRGCAQGPRSVGLAVSCGVHDRAGLVGCALSTGPPASSHPGVWVFWLYQTLHSDGFGRKAHGGFTSGGSTAHVLPPKSVLYMI